MEEEIFEQLPNVTPAESLAVLTSEKELSVSWFATDKGREMLRRAYFSCAHTNAELAEIFNTTPEAISAFLKKQGWPAEREKSRKEGEIALGRQKMRIRADEIKTTALEVAAKGLNRMAQEDFDGEMVLATSKAFRALVQSVSDIAPSDETKNPINNSIINIGSQVVVQE